ncbi:MAG: translation initiation factor IF-2, partial [Alistipes sp.]|nr:translation initiation factor IF-2 [Alistipes sp.]
MANEKKLRLIQVAKEFKVGLNTITDFLQKKGIKSDGSPNTLVDGDTYAILEKEFGSNRAAAGARDSVRERISQKQTSISLDGAQPKAKEEKEVIIKSNMIHVKDEIQQPKFLGKIDLDAKNEPKKEEPKPVVEAPKVAEQPKVETPKVEEKPVEKPVEAPKVEKPVEVKKEEPKPVVEAPKVVEQPKEETPKVEEKKADNVFRPGGVTLQGPQVLGTMDVSGFVPGGKHKRKRLQKEKVDVTKAQKGQQGGGKNEQRGGGQQNQNRPGQQQQNQPKPGEGRRNKNKQKPQPKPVVRPEVSDEEVSKQVKDTLARLTAKGTKTKASKYRKEKREIIAERMNEEFEREVADRQTLKVTEFVTVSELATMMNVAPTEVIMACMNLGLMVSINQRLDAEALVVVAEEFGFKTEFVSVEIQEAIAEEVDTEENLVPRPPIVTVMGHVDHGKTSLLDNIRKTNVIAGEAGGITQHIGAYSVELNGQKITFLDTPGHEAFTAMRARGAKITDVAIIIVAADDSVMPQTIEAINHAQAAGVPMVFAINKIDKPQANPEHIKEQLSAMNYLVESWGGKYQDQEISAKKGLNLDKLLEKVLLEAEMLELKANPDKRASGSVIESTLDKGRGYVSTILVQSGTLRVGDVMLSGTFTGRVKAMFNENGKKVTEAGPSTPVQVLGLNGAPQAGDSFNVMEDDRSAREIANKREQLQRMQGIMTQKHVTLDEIGRRIAIGSFKELNIIVKGDVD